jgi:hypothetical protein
MLTYTTNLNTEHRIKRHVVFSINDPLPAFHRKKMFLSSGSILKSRLCLINTETTLRKLIPAENQNINSDCTPYKPCATDSESLRPCMISAHSQQHRHLFLPCLAGLNESTAWAGRKTSDLPMHVADTAGTINTISPSSLRTHLQLRGEALSTAIVWAVSQWGRGLQRAGHVAAPRGVATGRGRCSCGVGCVVPAVHNSMHRSRLYTRAASYRLHMAGSLWECRFRNKMNEKKWSWPSLRTCSSPIERRLKLIRLYRFE